MTASRTRETGIARGADGANLVQAFSPWRAARSADRAPAFDATMSEDPRNPRSWMQRLNSPFTTNIRRILSQ